MFDIKEKIKSDLQNFNDSGQRLFYTLALASQAYKTFEESGVRGSKGSRDGVITMLQMLSNHIDGYKQTLAEIQNAMIEDKN